MPIAMHSSRELPACMRQSTDAADNRPIYYMASSLRHLIEIGREHVRRDGSNPAAMACSPFSLFTYLVPVFLATFVVFEICRPDLLLVGNVTIDVLDGKGSRYEAPGGAVTYAGAVAKGFRQSACIVTLVGIGYDLTFLGDHSVYAIPSHDTLTFEHTYTWFGNQRRLRVTAQPDQTLSAKHVPWRCRVARTVLVGPLTQTDVDVASFTKPSSWIAKLLLNVQYLGVMAQGYQRKLGKVNRVEHIKGPSPALESSITRGVNLFLSDVETDPWSSSEFGRIVSNVQSLVVTRGAKGVSVYQYAQEPLHIPAVSIKPLDTNGAGDTFATTFMIKLADGMTVEDAGMSATWAASRVCLKPQSCKPACCAQAVQETDETDLQPHAQNLLPQFFKLDAIEEVAASE
eukprot:jgi/Ulvmu1/3182/UM015_0223.1